MGASKTVDNLQKYFCHGWYNTVVATDPQLGISDFCSEYAILIIQLGCSQKGSCCLKYFSFAECFINISTTHLISWKTESRSLNGSSTLQCYTVHTGVRTWQCHKTLMLLIYLLSVLIFARLWFITILDMPAYALLTVGEGLCTVFSTGKGL